MDGIGHEAPWNHGMSGGSWRVTTQSSLLILAPGSSTSLGRRFKVYILLIILRFHDNVTICYICECIWLHWLYLVLYICISQVVRFCCSKDVSDCVSVIIPLVICSRTASHWPIMHLARQDALAPYSGGSRPKSRGYVTVREPAKGFFIAGSSLDDLNGIYAAVRLEGLGLSRKAQIAYRNDTGWIMALMKAPPEPKKAKYRRRLDRSRLPTGVLSDSSDSSDGYTEKFEWTFVDPLGRERFAHKGDTIIPGAGLRRWHLHREHTSRKSGEGTIKNLPQLYWHECLEEQGCSRVVGLPCFVV